MKSPGKSKGNQLRQRAEKLLSAKSEAEPKVQTDDLKRLFHEWQLYQTELESQNAELRMAQRELEESRSKYADLYDFAPIGCFTLSRTGQILDVNLTGARLLGLDRKFLIKRVFSAFVAPDSRASFLKHCEEILKRQRKMEYETKILRKDGTSFYASIDSIAVGVSRIRCAMNDITERKEVQLRSEFLGSLNERMRQINDPEELLRVVSEEVADHLKISGGLFYRMDTEGNRGFTHRGRRKEAYSLSILSPETISEMKSGRTMINCDSKKDRRTAAYYEVSYRRYGLHAYVAVPLLREGRWVSTFLASTNKPHRWSEHEVRMLEAAAGRAWSAFERAKLDSGLRENETKYRSLFSNMASGFAYLKVLFDPRGRPVDYVVLEVNKAFEELFSLKAERVVGKRATEILPGIEKDSVDWIHIFGTVALTGKPERFEDYSERSKKWYSVSAYSPKAGHFAVVFEEVTKRKRGEQTLRKNKERFEILSETAGKLLAADRPRDIVGDLCLKVMTHLDCDAFLHYLADREEQRLHLEAYAGIPEESAKEMDPLQYGVSVCGCAARDGERIIVSNIPGREDPRTEALKPLGFKAFACHPLSSRDQVIGTLAFGTRSRVRFTRDELALMKTAADQISVALDRKHLLETAQRRADELETTFSSMAEPVVLYNEEGIPVKANTAAISACGFDPADAVCLDPARFIERISLRRRDGTAAAPEEFPFSRALLGEKLLKEQFVFKDATGSDRIISLSASPLLADGAISGAVTVWNDITEREQLLEEVSRSRDELEIRVDERTAQLAKTVEKLKAEIAERKRTEEALRKMTNELRKRAQEINCLYSISYYVDKQYLHMDEKLYTIANLIPSGWQYPEITCARILLEGKDYRTENFRETPWKQSAEISLNMKGIGGVEVFYLEERAEADEGPFLKEERELIGAIALELGDIVEHWNLDAGLRRANELLESMFTNIDLMVAYMDKDFNFIRVNRAYAEADEKEPEFFVGKNHFDLYPNEENKAIFRKVAETGIPHFSYGKPFVYAEHPERGVTYWDWSLHPVKTSDGSVGGLVLSLIEVTERVRAEEKTRESEVLLRTVLETLPVGVAIVNMEGRIVHANPASRLIWAGDVNAAADPLLEYRARRPDPDKKIETEQPAVMRALATGDTILNEEIEIECFDGTHKVVLNSAVPIRNVQKGIIGGISVSQDITERKEAERRTEATNALLSLFAQKAARKEYVDSVVELLRRWSDCRCIGIRILNEGEYLPYESFIGFSPDFWQAENGLSVRNDQCACIRVLTGCPDPQDQSVMTPGGSFRCDNTFEFFNGLSKAQRTRYRGGCIQSGFRSVAIIPLRHRAGIVGTIHLADERERKVPIKIVQFIESLSLLIGEAIHRFSLEEEVRDSEFRLRHLSSQLLSVQEAERRRIAREIHDSLGQSLSAIKFRVEAVAGRAKKEDMVQGLKSVIPIIRQAVEEGRRIQMDLRPSVLDDLGILATMNWFCREFQKTYPGIEIEREIGLREEEVPDSLKVVIYRISQEALNNIAKHSKAKRIVYSLRRSGSKIELSIRDDGRGFHPGKETVSRPGHGMGLESMRERAQLSGGSLRIDSEIGKGSVIEVTWSL